MKHQFEKRSALTIADDDLVRAVGKAMIVFAAIEGAVNFTLSFLIKNHVEWERIADTAITRRLELLSDRLLQPGTLDKKEVEEIIIRAKKLFRSRNLIAHNPLVTSDGTSKARIHKLGAGSTKELSAEQICMIADEADHVYDEIWQLFSNCQMELFETRTLP